MIGFTNAKARASLQVNKAGTIYNTGQATGYAINKGGTIYTFPQNDKCVLNLSANTWQSNSLSDSSFMINKNITFSISGSSQSTFGNYSNNDIGTDPIVNNVSGHWYLPQRSAPRLMLSEAISSAAFTAQIEFKIIGNMTSWADVLLFTELDYFRLEKGSDSTLFIYKNSESAYLCSVSIPSLNDFNTVTVVNSASRLEVYLADQLKSSRNSGGFSNMGNISNFYFLTQRSLTASMGATSCIRRLRLWSTALTAEEVKNSVMFP